MKFTKKENSVLSEIYRRLNYFHKGNINANCLYLGLPSEAKVLSEYDLIKPLSREIPRSLNWYNLTDKGKEFFSHYICKIFESTNSSIFNGTYIKNFDKSLL